MTRDMYWISAICFTLIMLTILIKEYKTHKALENNLNRVFRIAVVASTLLCLQDVLWGLCYSHRIASETMYFISSEIFHFACVASLMFWVYFILTYLKCRQPLKSILQANYALFVLVELVLIVENIFKPVLFSIVDGEYVEGRLRFMTYLIVLMAYIITTIVLMIIIVRRAIRQRSIKQRHWAVLYASIVPIVLGIFQIQDPNIPLTSIGLALSMQILYVYVVSKEREGLQQSKTLFLQNMSHEIRTSLNSIYGFAQLLALPEGTWNEKERNEYCTHIHNSYNMLDMLLNDLMVSTRYDTHKYSVLITTVNVIEACNEAIDAVSICKPSSAEMTVESDLPEGYTINSDGRRIRQILQNLLTNAYQFVEKGKVKLHVCQKDDQLEFSVFGIDQKHVEAANATTGDNPQTGRGLRLSISQKMAELIGGSVMKEENGEKGSCYVFRLKAA